MRSGFRMLPSSEIFQLNNEYNTDLRKNKINGNIGVYLDDFGKPYVIPVVKKAISSLSFSNFNYFSISGEPSFLRKTTRLVLGKALFQTCEQAIAKQGVIGGTNGLFIWGNLIKQVKKKPTLILSNPSWPNHEKIFSFLGFNIKRYNHLDVNGSFNLVSLKKAILQNPKAFVLFHGGPTHNPTGVNPKNNQWIELAQLIKQNRNNVCFDFAYMGLGDNIESDCFPIRLFVENNIPTSVIISYSKNMSLYQHRTGVFFTTASSLKEKEVIESNLKNIFRIVNSNPSAFGELIVKEILKSKELKKEWTDSLSQMVESINRRRKLFAKKTGSRFKLIADHKGLFSLLNLNKRQIKILKDKYGIYLLSNSRINFGGISLDNIPKVAKAVLEVAKKST